jgi:carbamoyl-phosphate synthase large subunit
MMKSIGQPVPESVAVSSTEEALEFSRSQKFPLIVRPDFTLGGTGGGIAWNEEELKERIKEGLQASPVHRVLVENYLFCPSIEVDL